MTATVSGTLSRNHRGRLRIPELRVELDVDPAPGSEKQVERCLDLFEDYCIVTQSVRDGLDVLVDVRTSAPAAGGEDAGGGRGEAGGYGAGSGVGRRAGEAAGEPRPAGD